MQNILKSINLAVAFVLELAMLAAFAYWGYRTGTSALAKAGLGIGAPLLVAAFWGAYMAPKSRRRLRPVAYLIVKAALFGLAALGLNAAGQPGAGIALAVVFILNTAALGITGETRPAEDLQGKSGS